MSNHPRRIVDRTLPLLAQGYAWLPDLIRRRGRPFVRTRVLGHHAVALRGPEAVRFFYDERNVRRHRAVPGPVQATLFGRGAVHTMDGEAHRRRKTMFLTLLTSPDGVADLTAEVAAAWDEAVASWPGRTRVVLFDEAAVALTRGVCRWAGIPLRQAEGGGGSPDRAAGGQAAEQAEPDRAAAGRAADRVAADLVAMVDGFATAGPRHWRARRARRRCEYWLAGLITDVRSGALPAPEGSALHVIAWHRDSDQRLTAPETAAVELLNVVRPTAAVSWFVAFAAHALHRWPRTRAALAGGDSGYATAFAHEVRRFYPFAPFTGGRAADDVVFQGETVPRGALVLLDVYGQNHDAELWGDPYSFRPERFLGRPPGRDELIPQGGGDPAEGHRCPGEDITVSLLRTLAVRLARLDYDVPEQRLAISLRRVPARPHSGFVLSDVRVPA